ncbi:MAG: PAS domain S-box protein, partial [Verrucomicrobia bacterium]|nr:PAS domain S-box protein [Verrucomicrobiota bacterium]
ILIVDDQPANVAVLDQMLRAAGYVSVASTNDPRAVCALQRQHGYDLILLDLQMPGMDGFQVMEGLKEIDPDGAVPVLVLTAQPGHKLRALKSGAKDFVSKPFDLAEVLMRVHNLLEVRLLHRSELALNVTRLENSQRIAALGDWEHDFARQRLLWSDGIYRILGISRMEFAPDAAVFHRLVHPDDIELVRREKKAASTGSRRVEFEHRIIRPDGEERHIRQIAEVVRDGDGRPVREVGTLQDITDSKQAGEELRRSEERYRLMFESNPSPMWVFDEASYGFLAVNAAAVSLYGYTREEFLGMTAASIHAADALPGLVDSARSTPPFSDQGSRTQHRKKDGTVFPVDMFVHGIEFAGRSARLVLAVDRTEAERAAAALRASEARFRALSESAPIGIFECDADGRVIYYNPALIALSGRPAKDSLGGGWTESIQAETRAATTARWADFTRNGGVWDEQLRVARPDGALRWMHALAVRSVDGEGRVTGFVGTIEDITERQRAEEELRGKTALLEAQIDSSIDGILMIGPDGQRILRNQRYLELMKIPPEIAALSGDTAAQQQVMERVRHPEALAERVRYLYAHPHETSWDVVELKDGTVLDRYSAPIMSREGKHYGRIWAFRDITANRAAERALRESEQRFKLVARAVSDVVWDWDLVADTLWWSEGFLTVFGFAAREVEPSVQAWTGRIHADERGRVMDGMRLAIDTGAESWNAEYRLRRKDGSYAFVQDRAYILRDAAGKAIRMVGGMGDQTERKRLDEHFLQAQKMEALGQFSGGVAHDFNNILAVISGYAELSRMQLKDQPAIGEHLGAVLQAAGRATDLVRQILTFSRQQPQARQLIQLRPVVEESIKLMRATLPSTIAFETAVATDAPTVLANANQIHQVLMNLATNAWHAMKDHTGRLQVKLERFTVDADYATIQPRLHTGAYARISVSDTGSGMNQATLRRIFEPFFTTKPPGEGTGLGLAVVHGIMDSHDGAVTVYSEPGEGTIFHLYFPAQAGEAEVHMFKEEPPPQGHGERILVVDDEELLARLGQQTLTALGYQVEFTTNSETALAMLRTDPHRFALVVTDQTMPGITGLRLATELAKLRPGLPVILLTGYSPALTEDCLKAAGVRQLLLKPINLRTLGVAVHAALAGGPPS